jgi:hypothetical protein
MPNQTGRIAVTLSDDNAASLGTIPKPTTQAILACEDNAIRIRADGTDPTASAGLTLFPGDILNLFGGNWENFLRNAKIINDTAGANGRIEGISFSGISR